MTSVRHNASKLDSPIGYESAIRALMRESQLQIAWWGFWKASCPTVFTVECVRPFMVRRREAELSRGASMMKAESNIREAAENEWTVESVQFAIATGGRDADLSTLNIVSKDVSESRRLISGC